MALTDTTKIIENGIVATGDGQNRIGQYAILVRNDRITEVAPRSEPLKNLYPGAEVIDAKGKMILPGFVDAHFHGESFLLRSITGTTPMSRWDKDRRYKSALGYLNGDATREELESVYRLAYFNALKSGITCLADFGLDNLDFSPTASYEAMKRVDLKGFIGIHNRDQADKCKGLLNSSIRFAEAISGEDDLTTYALQSALRSADDLKIPLIVHLGETKRALETIKKNFRRTIVQLLNEYHLFDLKIQLSHMSALEGDDADVLAAAKVPVVVAPHSAMLKEVDPPPLGDLLSRGVILALGTDWGIPDPFVNIRAFVTIGRMQNRPVPGAFELLALCTRNPARALGLHDEVGTIEPGKKADLTFVDASDSRRGFTQDGTSLAGLLSAVLLESSSRDVSDVMMNGNFYVRRGTLLTYSEEDLIEEGNKLLAKLQDLPAHKETPGSAESVSHPAPILNFEPIADAEEIGESSEEGFRIVKKEKSAREPQKNIIPIQPQEPAPAEPARTVKKVFGEDDL